LPSEATNSIEDLSTSAWVQSRCASSTSFIAGTGEKKCIPTKRSPRVQARAMSAMRSVEVFDA
jgi:hypothetical protein